MTAPDPQRTLLMRGLRCLRDRHLNLAEEQFDMLLAIAPGHTNALRLKGVAAAMLGRTQEGLTLIEQAAAAAPGLYALHRDLAAARILAGDPLGAAEAWARGSDVPLPARIAFASELNSHRCELFDYPFEVTIRYGADWPPHPELAALIEPGRAAWLDQIRNMGAITDDFGDVPRTAALSAPIPMWNNGWFPPLDAMLLTHMLKTHRPARFIEIGSGFSTKFARRAVSRYDLPTRLISVDPQPRAEIDTLCDEVIRHPLETVDQALFQTLEPGDILFLDSSHRAFQGSDVTVFFLEVLPRLKPGVIVHMHDIYLPEDYISGHLHRMWNEQYLLATALLYGDALEILFPAWWACRDPEAATLARARLMRGPTDGLNLYGVSFWLTRRR
ncbi:class I SAM-dependent methyltransferase [Brevundimonas sp.]|jgi:predicted O-methyltransferase YrrM|uniref:class I SAM-dependent methyltransferase n=2 Tax=Brevundimonas sp. TaxID=1871086 RepID=UPI0026377AFA|nr:class I SAM-dependent methyltransferase [Brevundimonas sp.]